MGLRPTIFLRTVKLGQDSFDPPNETGDHKAGLCISLSLSSRTFICTFYTGIHVLLLHGGA